MSDRKYSLKNESVCPFCRFSLEWQWCWLWHRWHYWHKLHTVDWQYKLSACSPQVCRGSHWITATKDSTPRGNFMLFFFQIIQLLVEETNICQQLCLFLAIIVQMGPNQRDMLEDYWSALDSFTWPCMEKLWNETGSVIYLDFYILVTIKRTWQGGWKLWWTVENGSCIWQA
jgi:hypothetical protein